MHTKNLEVIKLKDENNFDNTVRLEIEAKSENTSLARVVVSAFLTAYDATVGEITDVKTAVSEAITNSMIHGYDKKICEANFSQPVVNTETLVSAENCDSSFLPHEKSGLVSMTLKEKDREIFIEISDLGVGIENIKGAMEPLFTTKPDEERSGLGFTVMESFMDSVEVFSKKGEGTVVKMQKKLGGV